MKRIVCILLLALLLTACGKGKIEDPTVTDPTTATTASETLLKGFSDLGIRTIISQYFSQRKAYLQGTADTIDVVVESMVTDEAAHKGKITQTNAALVDSVVVIDLLRFDDRVAEVATTETATFEINGETRQENIVHLIRVYLNTAGYLVVGSDGYTEETTGFVSASYLSGETFE